MEQRKTISGHKEDTGNHGCTGKHGNEGKTGNLRNAGRICGEFLLDLLFPRRCPVCDRVLRFRKELVCPSCFRTVRFVREPFCMKCGKSLPEEGEYCRDCREKGHLYVQGAAVFEYAGMAPSIYRFKYGGRQEYAEFYGKCMAEVLGKRMKRWGVQALIPVPIHPSRKRRRGYNQAELLAEVIGSLTGIPVRKDIIARGKKTVPQKDLNVKQRQNNLKKAFKICYNDVKLSTIIIIDDIYTTGSTVDAMAREMRRAGIQNIYFVALAIGSGM